MALARALPEPSARYDAFRAKLSLLTILQSRGYDLEADADMLNPDISLQQGYKNFQDYLNDLETEEEGVVNLPPDTKYKHPRGLITPLNVIFLPATSVTSRLTAILGSVRSSARRSARILHLLFVVDEPRSVTSRDAGLLGNNTLEILSYQNLLVNPLTHFRSPTYIQKLGRTERATLLSSPGIQGRRLPAIQAADPVTLFLDLKPGDVCRVTDTRVYTGQNMDTINYRIAPDTVVCSTEGCNQPSYTFRAQYCRECLMSTR